jgi:hypothetical protein
MSGTLNDLDPLLAAVLYSFQHAREDLDAWTKDLGDADLQASPLGLAPVAFHIRHIAGSVDRLMTYARGEQLSAAQMAELRQEKEGGQSRADLFASLDSKLDDAAVAIRAIDAKDLAEVRGIGRKQVPVPLGTLLVHIAEHTQRHVGESIVTVKAVRASS